jgi:hypothetical protein
VLLAGVIGGKVFVPIAAAKTNPVTYKGQSVTLRITAELKEPSNSGSPFTATISSVVDPQYFDVDRFGELSSGFR